MGAGHYAHYGLLYDPAAFAAPVADLWYGVAKEREGVALGDGLLSRVPVTLRTPWNPAVCAGQLLRGAFAGAAGADQWYYLESVTAADRRRQDLVMSAYPYLGEAAAYLAPGAPAPVDTLARRVEGLGFAGTVVTSAAELTVAEVLLAPLGGDRPRRGATLTLSGVTWTVDGALSDDGRVARVGLLP